MEVHLACRDVEVRLACRVLGLADVAEIFLCERDPDAGRRRTCVGRNVLEDVAPKLLLLSAYDRVRRLFPFRSCRSTCLSSGKGSRNDHERNDLGELRVCLDGRWVCHEISHGRRWVCRVKNRRVERRACRGHLDDHDHGRHGHDRHLGYGVPWLLACV